jgi:hypothetical protein
MPAEGIQALRTSVTLPRVSRRQGLVVVARGAAPMAVAGAVIVTLSYWLIFPDWVAFAFLGVGMALVVTGVILRRLVPRFTGSRPSPNLKGREPARWLGVLAVGGFISMWVVLAAGSGSWHGNPERTELGGYMIEYKGTTTLVTRAEWLAARRYQTRVLVGISTAFLSITSYLCASAAARIDQDAAV